MTDTEKLLDLIKESGLKIGYIAMKLGITRQALYKKIRNRNKFSAIEIKILCEILCVTSLEEKESIFFANNVDKMPT